MARPTEGIYCLANDGVSEWLVALLRSIRVHEGEGRRVIVIPFDQQTTQLRALQHQFDFEFFEDTGTLDWLDALAAEARPDSRIAAHAWRKLAVFFGPLDSFLFVDADAVLVQPVEPFFAALRDANDEVLFLDEDMDEVFHPGPLRDALEAAGARGFNSGIFGCGSRPFATADVEHAAASFGRYENQFVSRFEQSFLNYLVHSTGTPTASFRERIPGLGGSWAGLRTVKAGAKRRIADSRWMPVRPGTAEHVAILHWAGYELDPTMPYRSVYRRYRLGESSARRSAALELRAVLALCRDPRHCARLIRSAPRRVRVRLFRLPGRCSNG